MAGCPIKRILTFKEAVVYGPVKVIDNLDVDVTRECQFSWSTDGVCWTSWVGYLQYCSLAKNLESDYFLRILIFGGLKSVYYNNMLTDCYNICLDQSNAFLKDFCEGSNLLQPYQNLDCALLLQQQMSDSVICMFGIPIYYLRVVPDPSSVDYTFKEWTLHNVVDIKQLKLMIPDGTMPSSNPKLTDFDFDWEVDWETELSKSQFAKAFGDTAFPKQRDLVYVPLMKRLWEVNSAYDEKNEGLLWRPTTWKLALVKYNEKTNVDKGDFSDLIDGWLVNKYEDTFGEREREEQERESGTTQLSAPRYAATNLYNIFMEDGVRKSYKQHYTTVQDKIYCHHTNINARNVYRFKTGVEDGQPVEGVVTYQKTICGDSGWLSFIVETPAGVTEQVNKQILKFGELSVGVESGADTYDIVWDDMRATLETGSTYLIVIKWDGKNKVDNLTVYPYEYPKDRPLYLLKPDMYWWDFEKPIVQLTGPYNDNLKLEGECAIFGWPLAMTNIKYYRGQMSDEDIIKECVKYTTNHEQCVINDLARPITDGHGYAVK